MAYPTDLKYTKDHEWVRVSGDTAEIGITRTFFDGTALASSATVNDSVSPKIQTFSAQLRYAF